MKLALSIAMYLAFVYVILCLGANIYSGSGLTLFDGNGPCANGFISRPPEMDGTGPGNQRQFATMVANRHKDHEGGFPDCCWDVRIVDGTCVWRAK